MWNQTLKDPKSPTYVEKIYEKHWPYLNRPGAMEAHIKAAIREAYQLGREDLGNEIVAKLNEG